MTNPQDSHVKVIKTEYVDSAVAKKQLTPQQQELKDEFKGNAQKKY